jgi:plastocyanin
MRNRVGAPGGERKVDGMKKLLALLAVVAFATLGLAACGGDDDDDDGGETAAAETTTEETTGGGGGGATVDISSPSGSDLAYDQTDLTTTAGSVTVNYNNPQSLSHDVVIEDETGQELGKTELISAGETSTTVDLQPGTYTFFCDVPGHREGGMEGTLTVQ